MKAAKPKIKPNIFHIPSKPCIEIDTGDLTKPLVILYLRGIQLAAHGPYRVCQWIEIAHEDTEMIKKFGPS